MIYYIYYYSETAHVSKNCSYTFNRRKRIIQFAWIRHAVRLIPACSSHESCLQFAGVLHPVRRSRACSSPEPCLQFAWVLPAVRLSPACSSFAWTLPAVAYAWADATKTLHGRRELMKCRGGGLPFTGLSINIREKLTTPTNKIHCVNNVNFYHDAKKS